MSPSDEYNFVQVQRLADNNNVCVINELQPEHMYDLRVRAINEMGAGDASASASSIITRDLRGNITVIQV